MNNSIFRQSSIDRLKSPEQLNSYIRVANPTVWLILAAIILLLIGVVIWGVFGTVESTVSAGAMVNGGGAICFVSEENAAKISAGQPVLIEGVYGTVYEVSRRPVQNKEIDSYLLHLSGLSADGFCYPVAIKISGVSSGVHTAKITVESINPITFVVR